MIGNRLGAALAVPMLGVLLLGCSGGEARPSAQADQERSPRTVPVETETVEATPFTEYVRVVGNVEADRRVSVAAEEGGTIRALYVEQGARVRAGDPLVQIDDRLLGAQAAQAEAEAALARETYERQRRLWEQEEVGTELAYLEAKYRAQQAEAQFDALRTRVDRTIVRAPFSGVVDARLVEVGSSVAPGTPVARLVDVDTVRVTAGVPERFAADIAPGAGARIGFDFMDGRMLDGEIDHVGAVVHEENRTFPVEIVVPTPGPAVKPGMVANVRIKRREREAVILIAQDAVSRTPEGYVVHVVEERDGRTVAVTRQVTLGVSEGGRVVIESGLEPGDRVIFVGQQMVADGDPVEVVNSVVRE